MRIAIAMRSREFTGSKVMTRISMTLLRLPSAKYP